MLCRELFEPKPFGFSGFRLAILVGLLLRRQSLRPRGIIAFLRGATSDPSERPPEKSAEQELAEEILRQRGEKA